MDRAGMVDARAEIESELGLGEGDRQGGPYGGAHDRSRVRMNARGEICRNDGPAGLIDGLDGAAIEPFDRSGQAGSQQGVHDHLAVADNRATAFIGPIGLDGSGAGHLHEPAIHGLGVARHGRRLGHQQDLRARPFAREQAGHDEPVASVVALSAHDGDGPAGQRAGHLFHGGDQTISGFLHQGEAGNLRFLDGAPVEGLHLGGGHDLHGRQERMADSVEQ
jgi:hypothetical protein